MPILKTNLSPKEFIHTFVILAEPKVNMFLEFLVALIKEFLVDIDSSGGPYP